MASSERLIRICDVSPRDGLQNLDRLFSVDEKIELIEQLIGADVQHIEVGSFVNPARVPQMAGTKDVFKRIERPKGVCFAALALNPLGAARALSCGIDELRYVIVASEAFSQRNQRASISEAEAGFAVASQTAHANGCTSTAVIAAAFGCPYTGEVDANLVLEIALRAVESGADEVIFADTIGAGVPAQVTAFCDNFRRQTGEFPFGFHFHNTRNTGYVNAFAAVAGGASVLDASTGGIGGCPFAPNATGNIATEDLCNMLHRSNVDTGVNVSALIGIVDWLGNRIPSEITGQLLKAGIFPEIAETFSKPRKEVHA